MYKIKKVFTLLRLLFLKIKTGGNIKFSGPSIISMSTEISTSKTGKISFGKQIFTEKNVRLRVRGDGVLSIGNNVSLNSGCIITCHKSVKIGKRVQMGQNVLIYDHDHDFRHKDGISANKFVYGDVEIGDYTWIGAGSIILRGTKVGKNCIIGAGSVVKGEFPDNSIIIQKRETTVKPYKSNN